ncbi:MAG: aminodeoxychorismate synthase, component I [Hyphomicrobiales bacterium]|nr:MAG: aminodeoxychorismate synthase, component I [Hyphomicrobiales bacterium]
MTHILLDHPLINGSCYLFSNPHNVITCTHPDQLEYALRDIENKCQKDNLFAAGFLSYEAGLCFEPRLKPLLPAERDVPLLQFGLFDAPQLLNPDEVAAYHRDNIHGEFALSNINLQETKADYVAKITRLKKYIEAGDIYQANYTFQVELGFEGDLFALYAALKKNQPTNQGGFLQFDDFSILSLSPELFFDLDQDNLTARPMKGTAPRGKTKAKDAKLKNWLYHDEKNRAENLMIVDLLRNDLSRVAEIGSVEVDELYDIETYDSLFQMTTGIKAQKRPNIGFPTMMKSLFPCGSITGAPKIRAMEIIDKLEIQARGVYCGSIGFLTPVGNAHFNVAIRTITALKSTPNILRLGIGGGIVADSVANDEYAECLLKMKFISDLADEFQLIESLAFDGDYIYLVEHMDRMCNSADYFEFNFDRKDIIARLEAYAERFDSAAVYKVRLLLHPSGQVNITHSDMPALAADAVYNLALSDVVLEKSNVFTRHKTTKRAILDQAREKAKLDSAAVQIDEVMFCNRQGFITEGSFTTIFVESDGVFYTPPLSAGLLNGVLRRHLLDTQGDKYKIKNMRFVDLKSTDTIYVGNSVRGLIKARLLD